MSPHLFLPCCMLFAPWTPTVCLFTPYSSRLISLHTIFYIKFRSHFICFSAPCLSISKSFHIHQVSSQNLHTFLKESQLSSCLPNHSISCVLCPSILSGVHTKYLLMSPYSLFTREYSFYTALAVTPILCTPAFQFALYLETRFCTLLLPDSYSHLAQQISYN